MSEATQKTCQFKSKYDPDYKCPEPPLEDSEKGYCIFHEPREDKDIKKFDQGIRRKLRNKDYKFRGYWFPGMFPPIGLSISVFKEEVNFCGATFVERVYFGSCVFEKAVYFTGSTFKASAFFPNSTFRGAVFFVTSTFENDVIFFNAILKGVANFGGTTFKEEVNFKGSTFEGNTNFVDSIFKKVIFLDNVKIKNPSDVDILFRKAKMAWHSQGNYVEEGKAHYQEMDYIRKQKKWYIRYIWANLFHRLLHGYGEKPHRVILWAVAIVMGCALLFMNFGIGETRLFVENLPTYNIFKILFKLRNLSWADLANIGRYFYFSVVTFTTLGYGDLRPVHPISHLISSIEAFTGMFMMALFVLTFGRKWRR